MTEKIEVALTFEDFASKNKSLLQMKQSKAENYQKLLTAKAVKEQTGELGFSDTWKKELDSKIDELQPKATEELKEASENVNKYLQSLVEAIFVYHQTVIETPKDEYIKDCANTIRALIAAGGGQLDAEFVFNATKILFINK